jgi:hypothetical protein
MASFADVEGEALGIRREVCGISKGLRPRGPMGRLIHGEIEWVKRLQSLGSSEYDYSIWAH